MSKFLIVDCPKCHLVQLYEWRAKSLRARKRCLRCNKTFQVDVSRHIRYDTAQQAREQLLRKKERIKRKKQMNVEPEPNTDFSAI
jgi:hypothetical protein